MAVRYTRHAKLGSCQSQFRTPGRNNSGERVHPSEIDNMGASNTKHGTIRQKPGERNTPDRMDLIMEDACIALHLRVKQKVMKMSNLPTAVRDKHISIFLENLTSSKEFFQWELYQALRSRLSVKYWVRLHNRVFENSEESLDITVRHMNRRELAAVVEVRKVPVWDRQTLKKDLGRLSSLMAEGNAERGYLVVYGTFPKGFQPPVLMIDREKVPKVVPKQDDVKLQPEKFRIRVYRVVHRPQDSVEDPDDVTNPADATQGATENVTSTPRKPEGPTGSDVMVTPRKLELPERVAEDDVTSTPRSLESPQVPAMGFTAEEKLEFRKVGLDLSPRKETSPRHPTDSPEIEEISESEEETNSKL
ncbi:hypothetical protein Bbelb_081110 [Branchiostoma belcheri]|nr:hypothetical protein Bbelb_081110 [Branchiostoma belcheri]